ncbi:MAG TPA: thiol-disulfide oxidoreductase DCC family protein [Saprospiraceae bacterium]|nr:thiol-disulfide oxidoreductase DCC family protein [Saprospiraceae bacterium]
METNQPILFFDGVCNLCNASVQRVIKADQKGIFRFASLQSEAAQERLADSDLNPEELKSVILYHRDQFHTRSDAVLESARLLGGAWSLLYIFKIIPRFIRDGVYDWVARNRYRWFGKKDACMLPTPELKNRFL